MSIFSFVIVQYKQTTYNRINETSLKQIVNLIVPYWKKSAFCPFPLLYQSCQFLKWRGRSAHVIFAKENDEKQYEGERNIYYIRKQIVINKLPRAHNNFWHLKAQNLIINFLNDLFCYIFLKTGSRIEDY